MNIIYNGNFFMIAFSIKFISIYTNILVCVAIFVVTIVGIMAYWDKVTFA